jgi:hypothetical protein
VREISTALGSDADFATIGYDNIVESLGKLGIIGTDTRQVLRRDDKLPYFTRDEVDPNDIDLTYAGYDIDNSQFMFAYLSNENNETSTTQERVLLHNYEERSFAIYKQRFSCFGNTEVGKELAWNQIDETIDPSWGAWDTTENIWNKIGIESGEKKLLAGDDYGFVYEMNIDYDDQIARIFGITQANPAVLTVDENAYIVGDKVRIENVVGMEEINSDPSPDNDSNNYYTITAVDHDAGTITIDKNTTKPEFNEYGHGGIVSKVIEFRAKLNEFNPWREEGLQCYLKEVEFLLDTDGGSLRIDIYDNSSDSPWLEDILVLPTSETKNKEFVKLSIENVADFHTIQMRQLSAANQVKIKSIRLLAEPAGWTND